MTSMRAVVGGAERGAATADAVFGYAPGKVILFGEHAVVYGQPAVAATLDRGIRVAVTARPGLKGPVLRSTGNSPLLKARADPDGEGPEALRRALAVLVDLYGARARELAFSVEGSIPVGAGLGSSAALAVAMLRGVSQFFGEAEIQPTALVERAFALERVFHGNPSGVDHTVIASGGVISYERGADGTAARVERLLVPRRVRVVVTTAGPHAGTARAVAGLRERAQRHPAHYDRLWTGIGALARDGRLALERGELAAVGELFDLNQGYLNALGVSTPTIETLCALARENGALGAKLSGAGGGGAVIALVDEDPGPVLAAFEAAGHTAFCTELQPDSSAAHVRTREHSTAAGQAPSLPGHPDQGART